MQLSQGRHLSMSRLGQSSLKEIKQLKNSRITHNSIAKWKGLRTTYENKFHSVKPQSTNNEDPEQEINTKHSNNQEFDFTCRKLCDDLCFHLEVFQKLYKENYRKKGLLIKFYGWDKEFQDIFFYKHKEELRTDITPEGVYQKMGFSVKNFNSRNRYNKLRLFMNEVLNNNKRQQQLQSKFMKIRLSNQMSKVDSKSIDIIRNRQKKYLRHYVQEIGNTQQMMLNCKVRSHNKVEDVQRIQRDFGKVTINDFYSKEENSINDVQKYFTRIRLEKR